MILRAGERALALVALAEGHQARHLLLGEAHFLAAELGERQVLHLERLAAGFLRRPRMRASLRTAVLIASPRVLLRPALLLSFSLARCSAVGCWLSGCLALARSLASRELS